MMAALDIIERTSAPIQQHLASITMNEDKLYQTIFQNIFERPGRLSFLIGSGCSVCAGYPMMPELTNSVIGKLDNGEKEIILRVRELQGGGRTNLLKPRTLHIESHLSELVDIASILSRRNRLGADIPYSLSSPQSKDPIEITSDQAVALITKIKSNICLDLNKAPKTLKHHTDFVRSVHQPVRDGKPEYRGPVDYYSLNYDPLLEHALSLCSVHYTDGMIGGRTGYWDPSTLDISSSNKPQARLYKLHGSIDWKHDSDKRTPIRLSDPINHAECGLNLSDEVLIYPASTKYKETQQDPFALLFDKFRKNLSRPGPHTIFVMGYSFGDDHVNRVLNDCLTFSSSSDLFLIALSGDDVLPAQLKSWSDNPTTSQRVLVIHKDHVISKDPDLCKDFKNSMFRFEVFSKLLHDRTID